MTRLWLFLFAVSLAGCSAPAPLSSPAPGGAPLQRTVTVRAFTADGIPVTVKLLVIGSSSSTAVQQRENGLLIESTVHKITQLPAVNAVSLSDFDGEPGLEVILLEPVTPPSTLELGWQTDYVARLNDRRARDNIEALQRLLTPEYLEYTKAKTVTTQVLSQPAGQ